MTCRPGALRRSSSEFGPPVNANATIRERGEPPEAARPVPRVLEAEKRWLLEGPWEVLERVTFELGRVATRLAPGLVELFFGNQVGVVDLPGVGKLEVRSGKWGREHYGWMLRDLEDAARGLPFGVGEATSVAMKRGKRLPRSVLLHLFAHLRWAVLEAPGEENLVTCWNLVLAEPHRVLRRTVRRVPPGRAAVVDSRALPRMVAGAPLVAAPGCTAPVCRALGGRAPEWVEETRARTSIDTPENRFALWFLERCARLVERVCDLLEEELAGGTARLRRDAGEVRARLERLRRRRTWHEIGPLRVVPSSSTVLHRRRGYRGLYRHFALLEQAARSRLPEDLVEPLLAVKDIATLYELWCFLRVVAAVRRVLGPPRKALAAETDDRGRRVGHGATVSWEAGVAVHYNESFSRTRRERRSWSLSLRPDIVLTVPGKDGPVLHLLDAKFRLRRVPQLLEGDADHGEEEPRDYRRSDVYKMHTYRDALPGTRCVFVLYPGDEFRFFGADGRVAAVPGEVTPLPGGVGAIPLRPEDGGTRALDATIARLLDDR